MDSIRRERRHEATRRVLAAAVVLIVAAFVATGCGGDTDASRPRVDDAADGASAGAAPKLMLREVGSFDAPVHAAAVPGTDLVAVVEKSGRVLIVAGLVCSAVDACPAEPVDDGDVVIDLRGDVSTGSEQGLLGLAFHPDWPNDPRLFINYTDDDGDTRIEAWRLESPTGPARRERELLRIEQPYDNHNGGHLAFGPDDLLYIGTGDGGDAGDPDDRAQKADDLLGKLLRIDVDAGGERGFGIPDGNVRAGAPEAWALGLRNPWRFSFDSSTGDLWIGDVGQGDREEIDAIARRQLDGPATLNFGWRRREGFERFDTSGSLGPGRIVDPVLDYSHDEGCSITGGIVYRGALVPQLDGWYLFADFCADDLRLLAADGVPGSRPREGALTWTSQAGAAQVASFAEVQRGELLVISLGGAISQVLPA